MELRPVGNVRCGSTCGPGRPTVGRPVVAVITDDINNSTIVNDNIPDIISRIAGSGVNVAPGSAGIVTDRQSGICSDIHIAVVVRINADPISRGFIAPVLGSIRRPRVE